MSNLDKSIKEQPMNLHSTPKKLILSYTSERDMDLLFVEEFKCSDEFLKWFLKKISAEISELKSVEILSRKIWHSVTHIGKAWGESDIVLELAASSNGSHKHITLLMENKIDAQFQDEQPARYRQRSAELISKGQCDLAYSILLAPNDYLKEIPQTELFDAKVSYESIAEYFEQASHNQIKELAWRSLHRKELVEQSINQYRRGYVAEINTDASCFWQSYYLVSQDFPVLKFKKPKKKGNPAGSTWAIFTNACEKAPSLPMCVIKNKLSNGRVDLEFAGWAPHYDRLFSKLRSLLETDMQLRKASNSIAISIAVPVVEVLSPLEEQKDKVLKGLVQAVRLQKWYHNNIGSLQEIVKQL